MAIEDKDTADLSVAPVVGPDDPRRFTDSGIEIKPLYTERDLPEDLDLGTPGEFPFTRGIHPEMYRKRLWTMRQYAGYASAKESNERYKYLLAHGSTGLSMAFDLPTQLGLDSDDPRSLGEVGRTGVAIQGFAAVCGGTQSLHTNGYDEALALPSERAAKLALRTQQVIAHESGATDTVDPFAGSYYVEALTAEIERRAWTLIERVDELGGSVNAIAFIKGEIEESAFGYHERYRTGQDVVVGVNRYVEEELEVEDILRVDPEAERAQLERLKAFKADRDQELAARRLKELRG